MKSKIEWTDRTWNPVRGCSRVSEGCRNCYAERVAARFSDEGKPFHGFARRRGMRNAKDESIRVAGWTGRVELIPSMLDVPLRWKKPRRIFVNSMSDLFHEALPDEAIATVFGVMAVAATRFGGRYVRGVGWTNQLGPHVFQVLTKRPQRMRTLLSSSAFRASVASHAHRFAIDRVDAGWLSQCISGVREAGNHCTLDKMWPLPNVWLGVSVEDQATADERIPHLLETPAAVRFVSYEPALGPVDFGEWLFPCDGGCGRDQCDAPPRLDWLIVGGESGPGARPCDVAWIRSIVAQCKAAGVPVFVKQLGARPCDLRIAVLDGIDEMRPEHLNACGRKRLRDRKGGDPSEWPEDLRVREFPR